MLDMATIKDRSQIVADALASAAREEERAQWQRKQPSIQRRRWYLLSIMPQAENAIRSQFGLLKIEMVYSPQHYVDQLVHSREILTGKRIVTGRKRVLKPMFPGYLFSHLDYDAEWPKISARVPEDRMRTIDQRADGKPMVIPEWMMQGIYELEIEKTGESQLKAPTFDVGDEVRVIAGAFAMFMGKIERLDSRDRIRVLLSMLGRRVPVELQAHQIETVR